MAEDKFEKAKKEAKHRQSLKGQYKTWAKSNTYKDLRKHMEKISEDLVSSAKAGVGGYRDGKGQISTRPLTPEEKLTMVDKAAGVDMIVAFIDRQLTP